MKEVGGGGVGGSWKTEKRVNIFQMEKPSISLQLAVLNRHSTILNSTEQICNTQKNKRVKAANVFTRNKSCATNPASFLDNITSKWAHIVTHDFSKMVTNYILVCKLGESTHRWTAVMGLQVWSEKLQRMNSALWVSEERCRVGCCTLLWMEAAWYFY